MADFNGPVPNPPEERSKRWFSEDVPEISPRTREVLEEYSKIPPEEINAHVTDIRDKAWAIHNYPCIGSWRFLDLALGQHALYPEVLERMLTGSQIYLDLGCAFGQDIRRLVADGVDSGNCYGADLQLDFINLGYELFRDRDTLKTEFIAANVFEAESGLDRLDGRVDVVGASSFFHLFNWDEQVHIGKRVVRLLRPRKGSLLLGRQVGNEKAGDVPRRAGTGSRFRHDGQSWQRLWDQIGQEVGASFETSWSGKPMVTDHHEQGALMTEISVRRL
ncbi:hypothetical protein BDY17DRAFT_118669 [Neohortaea acidophila]|uniref:Methyltransferase domain-containing protein n=1 Tax=Neohortaea acidophila TaxID=245834 RepID=A0A6A6PXK1_9PEZI|nr:uncharacterized protein BDY17DRAFT_118669 [Neohortaea acidophila]KAF2483967.1 hypothetical protein BDY17DRAFT_118669 [Neohortaea acidophila]